MHLMLRSRIFVCLLLNVAAACLWSQDHPNRARPRRPPGYLPVVSSEKRKQILDLAFPRSRPAQREEVAELVVRFLPSFHAESQIQIAFREGDNAQLDVTVAAV